MPGKMAILRSPSSAGSPSPRGTTPAGPRPIYKTAVMALVATTALLLFVNTSQLEFTRERDRVQDQHVQQHQSAPSRVSSPTSLTPVYSPPAHQGNTLEQDQDNASNAEDNDEKWRFDDDNKPAADHDDEKVTEKHDPTQQPSHTPTVGSQGQDDHPATSVGVLPAGCPTLFLRTSPTPSSFASSSSTSGPSTLDASQVTCDAIPSLRKDFSLSLCRSNTDCGRGFIQVVHHVSASTVPPYKVSDNAEHDRYFHEVAGPEDFYFLFEGNQRLALSTKRYHKGAIPVTAAVSTEDGIKKTKRQDQDQEQEQPQQQQQQQPVDQPLVYRADFQMTLPGPIKLSAWLTYENFRAIRENRPGVWPQWTHEVLVTPKTEIGTICADCETEAFVELLSEHRQKEFEVCDRMAPVRGAYWREDLAAMMYRADQDPYNAGPGVGAEELPFTQDVPGEGEEEEEESKGDGSNGSEEGGEEEEGEEGLEEPVKQYRHLTKGWRFVPQGCTMTKTERQTIPPSSQEPITAGCDSIETKKGGSLGGTATLRDGTVLQPVRNILFTGDSQVRTTYNMILGHHRPYDLARMKYPMHTEYISITGENSHVVMLEYKADQFLADLLNRTDESLDRYDTVYLNLGQWPASGPIAGGQWSTEMLMRRWQEVVDRLTRWRASRSSKGLGESRVIWAGENAFPMRTDHQIRTKVDWRTNARLGFWDDLVEENLRRPGSWFRRLNAWALTFPMIDEVLDRAHFQETDAIDAIRLEALFKLDLCSSVVPDMPYDEPDV
ncbi:hypothetical protein DFQ27_007893 [Actinomortierella ambigua]|uniref:Uncharacterized protein n=1 Tax=Actinomortierella ambigua TaxID=1343610 RepID=A0A9P6PRT9_9FUNG|nr:hypothetical protein DFQ27_007893 [Actinomortierella ambigua]